MSPDRADTRLRISDVIRRVHQALVKADTRTELETGVCESFANSEPYVFAWIGIHDTDSDRVLPRAIAGQSEAYLDDISIRVHESPEANGPTATAIRTQTAQVIQDIQNDPDYEPWRQQATSYGFASSAAIPLAHDSELYGVVNIYSDRPQAFNETERTLLEELGETIATRINGIVARQQLKAQKRQYERLNKRISTAYYAVDEDWTITYWNDQMADRTGTPAEAVLGQSLWEAFPELLGTANETEYRTAMETNEHRSFETHLDDPYEYWVEMDVYPDENGLSVFSREITERKEYEQKIEEQRDNLELLNQVVRHDIRNNLQVIQGRTNLLEEHVDESGQEHIDPIQKNIKNAIELTKTARDLNETMLSTEADVEPVRLNQHLDSVIKNARSEFDAIVTVEDSIPNSIVPGNELLEAVFRNLIQNAVVHNDKETTQIQLSTTVADETLTVAVADNGPGIPDNQKDEIFGKGEKGLDSPGTGIGLYLVQTLVDQYGGDVWVEDNEPDGSVFVVELPIADAEQG